MGFVGLLCGSHTNAKIFLTVLFVFTDATKLFVKVLNRDFFSDEEGTRGDKDCVDDGDVDSDEEIVVAQGEHMSVSTSNCSSAGEKHIFLFTFFILALRIFVCCGVLYFLIISTSFSPSCTFCAS